MPRGHRRHWSFIVKAHLWTPLYIFLQPDNFFLIHRGIIDMYLTRIRADFCLERGQLLRIIIYYMHTDIFSLKSYVVRLVNFHTDANEFKPIKEANDVFSHVRKMINIVKSHRVVWFAPKFPPFYRRLQLTCSALALRISCFTDILWDIKREKTIVKKSRSFSRRRVKNCSEIVLYIHCR